jgi:transcriptional regulator with XRE-family HTH domain
MSERQFRSLAVQVDEACEAKGIFRKDVADIMGVSHPYISQIISRGGTADHIEQIAKALEIDPYYFDRYHILTFLDRITKGEEWANDVAALLIDGHRLPKKKQRDLMGKLAA